MSIVFGLLGCGGSGDTKTVTVGSTGGPPLSKPEYIAKADALCGEYQAKTKPFEDKLKAFVGGTEYDAAADAVDEAEKITREGFDKFKALPKPEADKAVLTDYVQLRETNLGLFDKISEALREEDDARIESLSSEVTSADKEADGIAKGYGFKVCGQQD